MRSILSEKNLVVLLFVMVLILFSLAQEDSRKLEKMQQNAAAHPEWRPANVPEVTDISTNRHNEKSASSVE